MIVNLQATPMGTDSYILECSICGPLGGTTEEGTHEAAFAHLQDAHGVAQVEWRPGPSPEPPPA